MLQLEKININEALGHKIFNIIGSTADEMNLECYVIGGYVRDLFLKRPSKDIDIVVVGSGIELAEAIAKKLGKVQTLLFSKTLEQRN
jgi:tRNA nucleotidyltransferase/poly(A) polymerase